MSLVFALFLVFALSIPPELRVLPSVFFSAGVHDMEIVAVKKWLLQLGNVDEDESDAVAISCVEFLLAETNAYYQQRCLAREAVHTVSSRLRDNIIDTVFAAALNEEQMLDATRFKAESIPEADQKDRHAVRSVPCRTPEKAVSIPSPLHGKFSSYPASRVGSSPDKMRSRANVPTSRRRRKLDKAIKTALAIRLLGGAAEKQSVPSAPSVQTIEPDSILNDEKPEIKAWREKCLKSLEASTRKPGFAKWVTVARAFTVSDNRMSMEVGVIAAPPANVVAALAATPVRMKSNVDSFSSILNVGQGAEEVTVNENNNIFDTTRRGSRKQSLLLDSTGRGLQSMPSTIHSIAENPQRQSKRRSQSINPTDTGLQQQRKPVGSIQLTDALSKRKLTRKPSSDSVAGGNSNTGWSSSRSLWRYEQDSGNATSRTFIADGTEFNASTLPSTINVASGVVLLQGESVIEGPEWVEGTSTMSRKRFDLQQRLATDALLNASLDHELHSPSSSLGSPLHFGHHPVSPLSELHFRDYEEVPAEPIPIPQLSPISMSALAIPRTHLTPSLSTPSLRVRTSATSGKAGGTMIHSASSEVTGSNRSICTNSSNKSASSSSSHAALENIKTRPSTALRAIAAPPSLVPSRARASSAASGSVRSVSQSQSAATIGSAKTTSNKYLREFPKPRAGVIRVVNNDAAGLIGCADDHQRTAWMS